MTNYGVCRAHASSPNRYSARAIRLVEEALVIDMLAPLRMDLSSDLHSRPMTKREEDDFRSSGIKVFHHAFGLGATNLRENSYQFMVAWHAFVGRYSHLFYLIDKAADLDRAGQNGKIAVIIGLQDADQFTDAEDVAMWHGLGLRCAQLTYNWQNRLGAGSTERGDGGLTDFGAGIIAAMNQVGMLVDVSHCGQRTTLDGIAASSKAVAITHANCRAINPHPRNKTDEAIRAMAAKGGVIGITQLRHFVRDREPTNVGHLVDHIDHVVRVAGMEHVGIGSDTTLSGYDSLPPEQHAELNSAYPPSYGIRQKTDTDGFGHPLRTFDLTEELIRRRYSDDNIKQILGGNFRRLVSDIWA